MGLSSQREELQLLMSIPGWRALPLPGTSGSISALQTPSQGPGDPLGKTGASQQPVLASSKASLMDVLSLDSVTGKSGRVWGRESHLSIFLI